MKGEKIFALREFQSLMRVKEKTFLELERSGTIKTVEKHEILFRSRDRANMVYIQVAGKSMIYNLTRDGKRKILMIMGPETLLNDHIMNLKFNSFCCETLERSLVYAVPTDVFLTCMKNDFALTEAVLKAQERKTWRMGHQLKNTMGSIYMERKLAAKLWKLQRDFGVKTEQGVRIDMDLSITFLADMLGAPRETTSRTCKTLVEYGFIQINKKQIVVLMPKQLAKFYHTGVLES